MDNNNKQLFVALLTKHFIEKGRVAHEGSYDANTLIVKTALQFALDMAVVTVVADDIDNLVLLVYHFENSMADIFGLSEVKRSKSRRRAVTPIRLVLLSIYYILYCYILLNKCLISLE